MGRGMVPGRFIEPPRSMRQQLRDAERALADDQPSEAVVVLGDLLAGDLDVARDLIGQDFLLDIESGAQAIARQSLMRTARDQIGGLTSSARETYEIRYGPAAKKRLAEAANQQDWDGVAEVRRRYFHTRAGYQASGLMATRAWLNGRATEASLLLDDVVSQSIAREELGDGMLRLYAAALQVAGREPIAEISLPEDDPQSGAEASNRSSRRIGIDQAGNFQWTGRSTDRNGAKGGQFPLSIARWEIDTTASPRQNEAISDREGEFLSERRLPIPTLMPIRVGKQVMMRTTERLVGVDHRTGKRFWNYPWQSPYEAQDEAEIGFDEYEDDDQHSDLVSQRVWNDVPYGQVTSDGERAYMVNHLEEVELARYSSAIMNFRGRRQTEKDSNTLVALNLAGEGKLVWRLGKDGNPESPLAKSFFLGPPLPVEGRLYAIVETAGDIELVCIDPINGDLLWRQNLVSVETGAINTDAIRRVAGAMPSEKDGILICPTGSGVVVAVDRHDRTIRWARQHGRSQDRFFQSHPRTRSFDAMDLYRRWDNSLAVIDGSRVLLTAVEADRLFGFDLITGEMLFAPKSRSQMRYLAGISGDRFVLVGGNSVRAYDITDGRPLWSTDSSLFAGGSQVCGRGYFDATSYYVPLSDKRILRISLDDGSLMQTREVEYPLGNMLVSDGEVIVQGPSRIAIAHGESSLRPWVEQRLLADENDLSALLKLSQLQMQDGQREAALTTLARARQIDPENIDVTIRSIEAMLATLREDRKVDPELIETLDQLIVKEEKRIEFLFLRIESAIEDQDAILATELLIELSSLVLDEHHGSMTGQAVLGRSERKVTQDAWIEARARQVKQIAGDTGVLDDVLKRIDQAMPVLDNRPLSQLWRLRRHLGPLDSTEALRRELFQRYRQLDDVAASERVAFGTQLLSDDAIESLSPNARDAMASLYANAGLPEDQRRFGDRDAVPSRVPWDTESDEFWPAEVKLDWPNSAGENFRGISSQFPKVHPIKHQYGERFRNCALVTLPRLPLALRYPDGRFQAISIDGIRPDDDDDKDAVISGGVMVLHLGGSLVAIDLYRLLFGDDDFVLWSHPLTPDGSPATKRRPEGTPFGDSVIRHTLISSVAGPTLAELSIGPILGDRVLMLRGGELSAIELSTGRPLWQNMEAPSSGKVVSDGQRVAVVSPALRKTMIFDVADGRVLDTQPFNDGKIWAACGSHVVVHTSIKGSLRYTVKMINPISGETLKSIETWSSSRNGGEGDSAYGRIVDGRVLAMMDHQGKAIAWDILEGRELFEVALPEEPHLLGLNVVSNRGRLVYLPKRRNDRGVDPSGEQLQTQQDTIHRTVDAMHAVSMRTGEREWSQLFEKSWGLTVTQPPQTPLLILSRSPFSYEGQVRKKTIDVAAVRTDTGEMAAIETGRRLSVSNGQLLTLQQVDSENRRVTARVGVERLTFSFVDQLAEGAFDADQGLGAVPSPPEDSMPLKDPDAAESSNPSDDSSTPDDLEAPLDSLLP